jgi:hypothetical protein
VYVVVVYMAAILAQMGGDAVRACGFGCLRRENGIRFGRASGFAHGGNVIYINIQTHIKERTGET